MRGAWTAPIRPVLAPRGRLVACPHAGAGPHALLPVLSLLPHRLEVVGVTLPGRERRFAESAARTASDPAAVVAAVLSELAELPPLPTVLFGHSMGSALAAALAAADPGRFAGAVFSAHPAAGTPGHRAGRWADEELLAILRTGGGTPDDILRNPTWRRHLLDLLRIDLTLGVRLAAELDVGELALPVTVLTGEGDGITRPPSGTRWGPATRVRTLPGGHFYLLDAANAAVVAAEIAAAFETRAGARR
jgi:surfactin synthase thioesterase subunit